MIILDMNPQNEGMNCALHSYSYVEDLTDVE